MGAAAARVHGEPRVTPLSPVVVPANAGTHSHRYPSFQRADRPSRPHSSACGYGPRFRGGDSSNPRHHHIFDLDIFFHAMMGALAPEAAFLHAAEWSDFGGDQAGVDADHAGLQRLGDAPDAPQVARIEIGGEP